MRLSRANIPLGASGRSSTKRWSSGKPEFMEDALHCNSDGMVVGVDRSWVVRAAGWAEWLSGGEKGFDGFVSQNEQRGHRPQTSSQRFVAAAVVGAAERLAAAAR